MQLPHTRSTSCAQSAVQQPRLDNGMQYCHIEARLLQCHAVRCAGRNFQRTATSAEQPGQSCLPAWRSNHARPLLWSLHWLPNQIVSLTFKVFLSSMPAHLSDLDEAAVLVQPLWSSNARCCLSQECELNSQSSVHILGTDQAGIGMSVGILGHGFTHLELATLIISCCSCTHL